MFEVFKRSWEITKLSFGVIKQDKELLLFPLFAGIFSLAFMLTMIFPTIITSFLADSNAVFGPLQYTIIFLVYLGLAFIATFFNVCVVYTTKIRFEGGNATFMESIKFAFSKLHLIFVWSLVAATVGMLLRMIDHFAQRLGRTGQILVRILTSILGMVWSIVTIFVVPSMVYNDLGPIAAIKKSIQVLKKTWGESLVRYYGLGLVQLLFIIVGGLLFLPLLFVLALVLNLVGIIFAISILVIYMLGIILIFNVATTVFNTALYVYADSGKVPNGYSGEVLKSAFKNKKAKSSNSFV